MWKRLIFGLAIENRKSKWPMQQGKQNLRRTQKCKRRARARTQIVSTDRRLELKPGRISITKANENKSKCMDDCRGQMRWRREREWKIALSHTGKSWMIWVGFILMNSCVIFALIFIAVAARRWFFFPCASYFVFEYCVLIMRCFPLHIALILGLDSCNICLSMGDFSTLAFGILIFCCWFGGNGCARFDWKHFSEVEMSSEIRFIHVLAAVVVVVVCCLSLNRRSSKRANVVMKHLQ